MNQAIEVTGGLFDLLAQIIVGVKIENVRHKVKGVLVVGNLGVQPGEVKPIGQVVLVDFAEVFITAG
jgi:hypothetical protein